MGFGYEPYVLSDIKCRTVGIPVPVPVPVGQLAMDENVPDLEPKLRPR